MASYRALRSVRHDAHGAVQAKYKYKNKKVQYYITAGDTNPHSPETPDFEFGALNRSATTLPN